MQHPANNTTELFHSGEHDNAGRKSIPIYRSSGEEVWLCLYARGWINLDSMVRYQICSGWYSNKIICDLMHHDKAAINAFLF